MTFKTALMGGFAASALAIAVAAPLARAQAPGSLYVFGDSLSDNGNIPRLTGILYPPSPPYSGYRFSNGPVWAEYLPALTGLGFKASNDYAVGGALSGPLEANGQVYNNYINFSDPAFPALPNELQEIQSFAATGGHFSPSDVVGIWIGGNNYFLTEALVAENPANAQQIVTQNVSTVLQQTAQAIEAVGQLGARQIILQNLVPFGNVPTVNDTPQQVALGDAIIGAHNAGLSQVAATLHQKLGLNILLINQQQISAEIDANPGAYGISNTTSACLDTPSCVAAPLSVQNTYQWWNVHPTTHSHLIIAEYVASALNGFDSLSVPARLLATGAQAFSASVTARMEALREGAGGLSINLPSAPMLADAAMGDTGPMGAGGDHRLSVYVTGNYDYGSRTNAPGNLGFTDNIGTVTGGADYRFNPHIAAGIAFGYGTDSATVNGGETIHANAYQFAGYVMAQSRHLFADGQVDYGVDQFNQISRPGVLAPITATPNGHTVSVVANAGYLFHRGTLTYGPVVGFDAVEANIGAYTEQGDPALTMAVQNQSLSRALFDAGIAASAAGHLGSLSITPHGSIELQSEVGGSGGSFASVFTDEPLVGLTTTYPNQATTWGVADLGLSAAVTGRLAATVDLASTFARSNGDQRMVTAGLRYKF
ncbi:autotransporter domain-containing protein [Acidiphilium sp.]|uniref:autotransporter domain-containing protein n=1 Tax=Acidiphilium sp. TaxID=527 RepID=UPI003CFC89AC